MSLERRRQMIEPDHPQLSVVRQCELVSISRSGFYHRSAGETPLNLELMRLIDAQFLETPWYGSRQRPPEPGLVRRHQCAAASGVRDGGRPPAIGLQEQVANRRKRRGSKARVVSVTEKAPRGVRWETGRRTTVNCRSSVESAQMTSKPVSDVAPGSVWPIPAYGPGGVRHRGSAILFQALTLNCGNLRWRWQAKGTSPQGEADNSDAPPRDGAVRSSVETAVMAVERRDGVIRQAGGINWATRRNPA